MKKIVVLMVVAVLLVTLVACGGNAAPATAEKAETPATEAAAGEAPESAEVPADSGDAVEIRFLDPMPGPARTAAWEQVIAKFEEANPGIKVKYESVAWDDRASKLATLATTNDLPDVLQLHEMDYGQFITSGWITDLTSYYESSTLPENFNAITQDFLIQNNQVVPFGGIYAIPEGATAMGMFVRLDWMKEVGLDYKPEWTWEEFYDYVEKVTDAEKGRYGNAFRGGNYGLISSGIYDVYYETVGKFYNEDGSSVLTNPEAQPQFERFYNMYTQGWAPQDSINWGYPEMVQGFSSGLCGTLMQTTEVIQVCEETLEDGTWGVYSIPASKDGNVYNEYASSTNYAIAESSENKDAAWKFIEFCSSPEINIELGKANYLIPVVKQAADDPYFGEGAWAGYTNMINKDNYCVKSGLGYYPDAAQLHGEFSAAEIQKYLLGQQDAATTLKTIGDAYTEAQQAYMTENPDTPVPMPFIPNK